MRWLLLLVPGLLLLLLTPLGCKVGIHRKRQQFVGDSWTPDAYVTVCRFCGEEC